MTTYAEELDRMNIGYDQGDRWSFNPARDGNSIVANTECDCSSSCTAIARAGGYNIDTSDPIYTGNFRQKAMAAGFDATSVKGWSLDKIVIMAREGDFLLGPGHVIYVVSRNRWWSAEGDERGRNSGGKSGDQTGREARMRTPYARSRGWEWLLTPPMQTVPLVETKPSEKPEKPEEPEEPKQPEQPEPRKAQFFNSFTPLNVDGDWGYATTRALQFALKNKYNAWGIGHPLAVDGVFGAHTVRALQRVLNQLRDAGLAEDGVWGQKTQHALQRYLDPALGVGTWGPRSTRALQFALNENLF